MIKAFEHGFVAKCMEYGVDPEKLIKYAQSKYIVRTGDTLSAIAKRLGIPVQQLLSFNKGIKDPNKIRVNQSINTGPDESTLMDWNPETMHKVEKGETGYGIANAYGMPFETLAKMNPQITDWKKLQIGTLLNR